MLDWLGSEADPMRIAFTKLFGTRPRPFGSIALQIGGFSDDKQGVQWNVAYDPRDGRQWVGVNLEGMQYDDWPVARLIERELRDPALPGLVREHAGLREVIVHWERDYWQATSRPEIRERNILPTPVLLGDLTAEGWRSAVEEARACLNPRRKYRGRATQQVTLQSGHQIEGEVSPHLTFRYMASGYMEWEDLCREGKACLKPIHEWATSRARKPVAF